MKRALLGGTLLVLAAAACTDQRGQAETSTRLPPPENLPRCEEVFVEQETIDPGTFSNACRQGDDMAVPRPVRFECEDGRTFVWNDFAFGYAGEPMTLVAEDDDRSRPVEEALECLGTAAAEGPPPGGGQAGQAAPSTTAAGAQASESTEAE